MPDHALSISCVGRILTNQGALRPGKKKKKKRHRSFPAFRSFEGRITEQIFRNVVKTHHLANCSDVSEKRVMVILQQPCVQAHCSIAPVSPCVASANQPSPSAGHVLSCTVPTSCQLHGKQQVVGTMKVSSTSSPSMGKTRNNSKCSKWLDLVKDRDKAW